MKRIATFMAAMLLWAAPALAQTHTFQTDQATWNSFVACFNNLQPTCSPGGGPLNTLPPQTANYNAQGYTLFNLAAAITSGQPLVYGQTLAMLTSLTASVNGSINPSAPPYNADATGATDSWAALQSAEVAAGLAPNGVIPSIDLPDGTFATSRPWILSTGIANSSPISQPRVKGSGRQGTIINPTFLGDAIVATSFDTTPTNCGVTLASAIVGSGHSLLFGAGAGPWGSSHAGCFFDLGENLRPVIANNASAGYFNGLSHFDVRFFFTDADTANLHCLWGSTGAWNPALPLNSSPLFGSGTNGLGYFCVNASGKGIGMLTVNGSFVTLTGSATITQGSAYEGELNYDSTSGTANLYYGTGGTVTRQAQQTGLTGTVNQRVDENQMLGGVASLWPYNSQSAPWAGNIQSLQFSNIARNTGSTYTMDTGNFVNDANTLWLDNFDLSVFPTAPGSSQVLPIMQVDNVSGFSAGNAWLALHNAQDGCCGGLVTLTDFTVYSLSTAGSIDSVDIFGDAAALDVERVSPSGHYVGIETTPNSSFGSTFKNIYSATNGSATSNIWSLGGLASIEDLIGGVDAYPLVSTGGGSGIEGSLYSVNAVTLCALNLDGGNSISPLHVGGFTDDAENGGTFPTICARNGGNFVIDHSSFELGNTSPQNFVQLSGKFAGNPQITFSNDAFSGLNPNPGKAIVDSTYATAGVPANVVFGPNDLFQTDTPGSSLPNPLLAGTDNNFLAGGNSATYATVGLRCNGQVTLATGAGVFSDPCINMTGSGAVCLPAGDSTTPANTFTVAPPTAGRSFTDGVTTSDTTLTSATAAFVSGDVGRRVHGPGISESPATFITVIGSGTSVTISQAETASASAVPITLDASAVISSGTSSDVVNVSCQ